MHDSLHYSMAYKIMKEYPYYFPNTSIKRGIRDIRGGNYCYFEPGTDSINDWK